MYIHKKNNFIIDFFEPDVNFRSILIQSVAVESLKEKKNSTQKFLKQLLKVFKQILYESITTVKLCYQRKIFTICGLQYVDYLCDKNKYFKQVKKVDEEIMF